MKVPSVVYILGHKYEVEEMDEELFTSMDAYGDCCSHKRRIRVYAKAGGSLARDTLLHEILHGCWNLLALGAKAEEEKLVTSLSTALIGLIDDPRNKDIVKFILGENDDISKPTN